jgi:hypothetical protein
MRRIGPGPTGVFPGAMRHPTEAQSVVVFRHRSTEAVVKLHQATRTSRSPAETRRGSETTIDMGTALDLLAAAVRHRGAEFVYRFVWIEEARYLTCRYANAGAPDCIVGLALAYAGVDVAVLEAMRDDGVAELYAEGRFPCRLTLGALAVLRAAQQSQDRGSPWGEVLDEAVTAAVRILELLPTPAFELGGDASG